MAINRDKIRQTAQKFVHKKKYARAITEYQKLVSDDPSDARTLLKIGDLQARTRAYRDAIATYDRVGEYYFSRGFALKAVAVYKQIRALIRQQVPQLASKYLHITPKLAEIYSQLNLTSDALAAYDEMAGHLQAEGRDSEAIEVFRKMVALDASNPLPHLRLAEACCRVHALDDAIGSFWHAGHLLLGLGRRDDALKVIERILHFKEDPEYARLAAQLYLDRNQPQDGLHALAKLQVCFQANPKDLDTLGLLGRAFTAIGQEAKSVEVYKEMARLAKDQQDAATFRGLVAHLQAVAPADEQVRALVAEAAVWQPQPTVETESLHGVAELGVLDEVEELEELAFDDGDLEPLSDGVAVSVSADVVVVEELEAVEELDKGERFDVRGHTQKALIDAASLRKLGLLPKAIEALSIAAELDPGTAEIQVQLAEVLEELGDAAGAADARISLAGIHRQSGDFSEARAQVEHALVLSPNHPAARSLLEQMNRARGGSSAEPLPTFDLDSSPSHEEVFVEADDPFGSDVALPTFPLDDTEAPITVTAAPPTAIEISETLEEIDFFLSQGLTEEARSLVEEALALSPSHALLLERRDELERTAGADPDPGRAAAYAAQSMVDEAPDSGSSDVFDIAASLEALDELDAEPATAAEPAATDVDVDAIFEKFKAGVREQISEADSATHYDLGVAYKEMGLVADAIQELELAARDPGRECMCWAMIGVVRMEQGEFGEAVAAYERGLRAADRTPDQTATLLYDLAAALELTGDTGAARARLEELVRLDSGYRDATTRLAALRAS